MSKSYYVDLKDGYDVGDLYEYQGKKYEVVEIEAFNQIMLVEEIKDEPQSNIENYLKKSKDPS